jgi:4-amino-4-deoxy-L-arabinose transferase-like glycosyltransferase
MAVKNGWLFTISVFVALLVPTLVQDGMFLDGITYSAISKNLAAGIGSFWKPHYTQTLYPYFYEHPPLVFGIQSLFFKFLGNGMYTERLYTFLCSMFTAFGIVLLWRLFNKASGFLKYSWLPVLLWISVPIVFWSFRNNMLENTLGIFTLFSTYFIAKALLEQKAIWLIPGSVLIVLAFLSKGFVGIFPLATVFLYFLTFGKPKLRNMLNYSILIIFGSVATLFTVFLVFPDSKENIQSYFNQQLLPALNNEREVTTNNRFYILFRIISELSLPLIVLTFFLIKEKITKKRIRPNSDKTYLFFLFTGISASFPLTITLKQAGFYAIPSIPYFIISICLILVPFVKHIVEKFTGLFAIWMKVVSILVLSISVVYSVSRFGKFSRDEILLKDVYFISQLIPEGTIIGTTNELCQRWGLIAYLNRIGSYSLDCTNRHEYFLIPRDEAFQPNNNKNYSRTDLEVLTIIKSEK